MRKALIRAVAVVAFGVSPAAHAQPTADSCDYVLNSLYQQMLDTLDIPHRDLLERAQQAWADYRDATCEVIAERPGYPEVEAAALETGLAFMARERTTELRLIGLPWPAP